MVKKKTKHNLAAGKTLKSTWAYVDKEIEDDKRRFARKQREIGKKRLNNLEFVHDMAVDDIHALFEKPKKKKFRSITMTLKIVLENGFQYGRTISNVPMPKGWWSKQLKRSGLKA